MRPHRVQRARVCVARGAARRRANSHRRRERTDSAAASACVCVRRVRRRRASRQTAWQLVDLFIRTRERTRERTRTRGYSGELLGCTADLASWPRELLTALSLSLSPSFSECIGMQRAMRSEMRS